MSLIFPYLTLQALGLGLTYEDISIIYGISPVIALAAGPIAGKQNHDAGYRYVPEKPMLCVQPKFCNFRPLMFWLG